MNRRLFLGTAPAMFGAARVFAADSRSQAPAVTRPRATSGDAIEPDWDQRIKITVGPEKADIRCGPSRHPGGGRLCRRAWRRHVQILPGTYRFRNAVQLRSGVRIVGSGLDSVCIKEPSMKTPCWRIPTGTTRKSRSPMLRVSGRRWHRAAHAKPQQRKL